MNRVPRPFLLPLSPIYWAGAWLWEIAFDLGILASHKAQLATVVVGNIEAGGTGKTPIVALLVKLLQKRKNVAVLSRGYGRTTKGFRVVETKLLANDVGDEPLLLKRWFPNIPVVVCENRLAGIQQIQQLFPSVELVLLDDAFQHRWLKPNVAVITTPAKNPFWHQWPLPGGVLRSPIQAAKRADALVITNCNSAMNAVGDHFINPVFCSQTQISGPFDRDGRTIDVKNVVAFCGIANPDRFFQSAQNVASVTKTVVFADHHPYSDEDLDRLNTLVHSFGREHWLLTTEKDHVRLLGHPALHKIADRMLFLRAEASFNAEQEQELTELIIKKCWKK